MARPLTMRIPAAVTWFPPLLLGALLLAAGCPTVDVGDNPSAPGACRPDPARFKETGGIWDLAIAPADTTKSCISQAGCHAQATGRSSLRLVAKARAELTDADWQQNYDVVTRFLNCATPEASPFLTKPRSDVDPHGGGDLWQCTGECEPITTVETWIAGG